MRTRQMHHVAEAGVIALGNPYAVPAAADGRRPQPPAEGERSDPTRPGWLSRLLRLAERGAPTPTRSGPRCATNSPRTARSPSSPPTAPPSASPTAPPVSTPPTRCTARARHACVGARVNGRLAAAGTPLRDGDTVDLLMAAGSAPSPEWLDHARTPAARIAISRWLAAAPGRRPRRHARRARRRNRPAPRAAGAPRPPGEPVVVHRPARRRRPPRALLYARAARRA